MEAEREMWLRGARGTVYVRQTSPELVVMSWYPHHRDDADWPGAIFDLSLCPDGSPKEAWERGDRAAVAAWLNRHRWWHPAPTEVRQPTEP